MKEDPTAAVQGIDPAELGQLPEHIEDPDPQSAAPATRPGEPEAAAPAAKPAGRCASPA